ncbi:MAG: hypothetical protein HXS50_04645, partial [Theionarchaea archaeon]|nr:hypothetical protein [Theionarchaea archaeon]
FYLSVDVSRFVQARETTAEEAAAGEEGIQLEVVLPPEIKRLLDTIDAIRNFFSQSTVTDSVGPPLPIITGAQYGHAGAGFVSNLKSAFVDGTPPDLIEVAWKLAPATSEAPILPLPPTPPEGFIITVSTLPEGIPLYYDRPQKNEGNAPAQSDPSKKVQPREYGPVLEGNKRNPVVLYGGADMVVLARSLDYNRSFNADGTIKPGYTRVYGIKSLADNAVIPLEALKDGDTYYFQRTFWLSADTLSTLDWMASGISFRFERDQMPHDAELSVDNGKVTLTDLGPATTYYVRIASCDKATAENETFKYDLEAAAPLRDTSGQPFAVPLRGGNRSSVSDFSAPYEIVFPAEGSEKYLETVETALAVLLLSRADMPILDELNIPGPERGKAKKGQLMIPGVALESTGLEKMRNLVRALYGDMSKLEKKRGVDPLSFRGNLRNRIKALALDLYEQTGPMPDLERTIVEQTQDLREIRWGDLLREAGEVSMAGEIGDAGAMTILESIDLSLEDAAYMAGNPELGVALNIYGAGIQEDVVTELYRKDGVIRGRNPFIQVTLGGPGSRSLVSNTSSAEETDVLLNGIPGIPGVDYYQREFYQNYIQADGTILVPDDKWDYLDQLQKLAWVEGSGDDCPVFYNGQTQMTTAGYNSRDNRWGMIFCRDIFAKATDNRIFNQTAIALGIAASAARNFGPGQWWNFRFFDSFPGFEAALDVILNWLEAIEAAIQGVVDQIIAYIEFLESGLIALQQLVQRINALIQSILGFTFKIPKCAALMLLSDGTGGVLGDFITAENKPSDSP